jgi:hypothetical protein
MQYGIESIKVECDFDRTIAQDVVCTMVKLGPSNASLSIEGSFVGEAHSIFVSVVNLNNQKT